MTCVRFTTAWGDVEVTADGDLPAPLTFRGDARAVDVVKRRIGPLPGERGRVIGSAASRAELRSLVRVASLAPYAPTIVTR